MAAPAMSSGEPIRRAGIFLLNASLWSRATSGEEVGAFASNMNKVARDHSEALSKKIPGAPDRFTRRHGRRGHLLASRAGDYVVGDTLVVDGGVAWGRTDIG